MIRRAINLIVIHCSATREDRSYTTEQMEKDHRARGFQRAGYHFYIRRSGEVVELRPLEMIPAHVTGYNQNSVGICYEGGLDCNGKAADTRTPAQKQALMAVIRKLLKRYPRCRICGHRDLSRDLDGDGVISPWEWSKQCPCFNAATEYTHLQMN